MPASDRLQYLKGAGNQARIYAGGVHPKDLTLDTGSIAVSGEVNIPLGPVIRILRILGKTVTVHKLSPNTVDALIEFYESSWKTKCLRCLLPKTECRRGRRYESPAHVSDVPDDGSNLPRQGRRSDPSPVASATWSDVLFRMRGEWYSLSGVHDIARGILPDYTPMSVNTLILQSVTDGILEESPGLDPRFRVSSLSEQVKVTVPSDWAEVRMRMGTAWRSETEVHDIASRVLRDGYTYSGTNSWINYELSTGIFEKMIGPTKAYRVHRTDAFGYPDSSAPPTDETASIVMIVNDTISDEDIKRITEILRSAKK